MPGRTRIAKPGERACGMRGCCRPAGLGTDHVGTGPCLRHGGADWRPQRPVEPKPPPAPVETRLRGNAPPVEDPATIVLAFLVLARRAHFEFSEAWYLAVETALNYMDDGEARRWWDVLDSTEAAWRDAYEDRNSRLTELPRSPTL